MSPPTPSRAVFLSYASQDAEAARQLCEALRSAGIEVWFDQSELRGGDAWDAAIRRQIRSCSLFIPILSHNSHSRAEGYFRLEWKLAIDRSHLIAADRAFLLPVVVDETAETDDRIPERFRDVQWMRMPGGHPTPAFVRHVSNLLAHSVIAEPNPAAAVAAAPLATHATGPTVTPSGAAAAAAAAAPRGSRFTWVALALLAVLGIAGLVATRYFSHGQRAAPYSLEDRRMTFAVLPFHAPASDEHATRAAQASTEAVFANIEAATIFAQTVPPARVETVLRTASNPREIAAALNVHFLIRGTLARASSGYALTLTTIDGATEQPLATETLPIPADALVPRWEDDVDAAVFHLLMGGMHAEVQRVQDLPPASLDVRDLSFRALDYWRAHRGAEARNGYVSASDLLRQALERAPDDALAIYLTAEINLCDCVMAWSSNPEEQRRIGSAALDKYLKIDPTDSEMLLDKAGIFQTRGRYDEALVVVNTVLQRHPDNSGALALAAISLVHLGRAREALAPMDAVAQRYPDKWEELTGIAADVHFAVGDYAGATTLARNAAARMAETSLRSPVTGPVRLTLAAAEAQLGHLDQAKHALEDFESSVAGVRSVGAARKWMMPATALTGFEPLYAGLKLAGWPD